MWARHRQGGPHHAIPTLSSFSSNAMANGAFLSVAICLGESNGVRDAFVRLLRYNTTVLTMVIVATVVRMT